MVAVLFACTRHLCCAWYAHAFVYSTTSTYIHALYVCAFGGKCFVLHCTVLYPVRIRVRIRPSKGSPGGCSGCPGVHERALSSEALA